MPLTEQIARSRQSRRMDPTTFSRTVAAMDSRELETELHMGYHAIPWPYQFSSDDVFNHFPAHVCQPKIAAAVAVGEASMVKPHQM